MIVLQDHEVHVWRVSLDVPKDEYMRLSASISVDESRRSKRFRFDEDRRRYVLSHGILRELLGMYLECDHNRIEFSINKFGKPYLKNSSINFNLSHSSSMALVAITMGVEVGIDVEAVNADAECLNLAKRFFAQSEYRAILATRVEDRTLAFYRCWTGKEAVVKAKGGGLSIPLDSFSISLGRETSQAICLDAESCASSIWTLEKIDVDGAYLGSLAYGGEGRNVICLDWNCSSKAILKKE